ncbi:MAG: hypothetical protein MJZ16_07750, partial [Bacteroidales bacterium]|nr:hypothetical protein [Bacteroidales bacterium]
KKSKKAFDMDFTYRIPGWVKGEAAGFKTVSKSWKSGDTFTVSLPMDIEVVDNPVEGKSIQRGPIVYTYAIPANWEVDPKIYGNLAGKESANPEFVSWKITPSGKYNYALVEDGLKNLKVEYTGATGFPFDLDSVPVKIKVPVKGVKDWSIVDERYTPALPKTVETESNQVSYIELVPYGSSTIRLTIFPTVEK